MLPDIAVDTCVLMHCDDGRQLHQQSALTVVHWLLDSQAQLCVDEGFHETESLNRSAIGSEYWRFLVPGSLGYQTVVALALAGRVKLFPKRTDRAAQEKIKQIVPDNGDMVFAAVSHQSVSKVLVSEDHTDFSPRRRARLETEVGVSVLTSTEVTLRVA